MHGVRSNRRMLGAREGPILTDLSLVALAEAECSVLYLRDAVRVALTLPASNHPATQNVTPP